MLNRHLHYISTSSQWRIEGGGLLGVLYTPDPPIPLANQILKKFLMTCIKPQFSLPLLKISLGNPYLKFLDLTKLFIAHAPMKKKSRNFVFNPFQSTLKYVSKNRLSTEEVKRSLDV